MIKKILALSMAVMVCFLAACKDKNGDSSFGYVPEESVACETHECTKIRARAATCEEEGNIEYWSCYRCDQIFADANATQALDPSKLVVPKLSHNPVFVDAGEATCSTKGNTPYWYCKNCYTYFKEEACKTAITDKSSVLLGEIAHTLTHSVETAPSGKTNGCIEHWSCSVCDGYYLDAGGKEQTSKEATVVLSAYNIPDFVVEINDPTKDPVVLQLTDTQIIDAGQTRPGRGGVDRDFWATNKMADRCYNYITELVEATNPDLIILTGDIIYGEFDDNGTALQKFINFMESLQIPWAPIFGNHENESAKGADWQCEQLENAQYCLFEQKTLTGNGNYSVGIWQNNELKRVFYMLDTNGCGGASDASMANGHTKKEVGFGQDQINWYTQDIALLKERVPNVKISFAYHIQAAIFGQAYAQYGFDQSVSQQDINIDTLANAAATDFGFIGRPMKNPWDEDFSIYNGMKALGVDSIFVGHEHCNSASVVYDGVRFQFGQKSSEYDRYNYINTDGTITDTLKAGGKSLMGGTVIPLSATDGSILNPYIYYCGYTNGQIGWTQWM